MTEANGKSPHELTWKEIHETHLRFNPLIIEGQRLSAAYGQIVVRSALFLNGGALFVLPAYISTVASAEGPIPQTTLVIAAAFFISGIICAVLCAYIVYWNYMLLTGDYEYELIKETQRIKEVYDTTHQIRLAKARDSWYEQINELKRKNRKRINWTLWAANALGLIAYFAFVAGCYFGGKAMLG